MGGINKKSNYKILRSETDIFPIIGTMGMVSGSRLFQYYSQWSKHENIEIKNDDGCIITEDEKIYLKDHCTLDRRC